MLSLSPNIFTNDINGTVAFYQQLGFTTTMSVPEEGEDLVWAMMTNGAVNIMFQSFESLGESLPDISRGNGGSLLFYIKVNQVVEFFGEIKDKVTVLQGLEKTFYGATEFSIKDNNGYVLTFAEHED
ncbi:VOC family protein [Mucilaginibacter myungsuensis]|uniref:VOC family protein n=1 Tax=Mucilaginibacter myungsuensis TaxID=649104 RepID=A0A929KX74_9SPHI|nr:VOC family protein [Mucilaginibacter myungsuensis]MBE9663309.1 VOC family protein [Mucilaginibacter myungsuensis]MDN3600044.1 VOC family protein [Mucilaginibacter myungsuensis]